MRLVGLCLLSLIVGLTNCVTNIFFLPSETNAYFFTSSKTKICVLSHGLKGKCFVLLKLFSCELRHTAAGRMVSFKAETCRTELQLLHFFLRKSQVFCCVRARDCDSVSELVVLYKKGCTFQSYFIFAFHYQNRAVRLQVYMVAIHWNNSYEVRFSHLNPLQQAVCCSTYL